MSPLAEDFTPEQPSRGLVRWMSPGQLRVGPAGLTAAAAAAFGLGVAATFAALAAYHWFEPRREGLPPWRWGRGRLH